MSTAESVISGAARYHVACQRAEEMCDALPDGCINLLVLDHPYHKVKGAAWDREHATDAGFLAWTDAMCARYQRILAPNGSLYLFASPGLGREVENVVAGRFEVLSSIRWRKESGRHKAAEKEGLRAYWPASEHIVFAGQIGADGLAMGGSGYDAKCDELRGFVFEPIRAYLDGERIRAGFNRPACDAACGNQMSGHYFSRVQWTLPTLANYEKLRAAFNASGGSYLMLDYESLRADYESLRRPFFVSADVPYTDVWDYPVVQNYAGKHECEKPAEMGLDIVRASSREGDVVADFFSGSGVFGAASVALGRRFIGCDMDPHWAEFSARRCDAAEVTGEIAKPRRIERKRVEQCDLLALLAEHEAKGAA